MDTTRAKSVAKRATKDMRVAPMVASSEVLQTKGRAKDFWRAKRDKNKPKRDTQREAPLIRPGTAAGPAPGAPVPSPPFPVATTGWTGMAAGLDPLASGWMVPRAARVRTMIEIGSVVGYEKGLASVCMSDRLGNQRGRVKKED